MWQAGQDLVLAPSAVASRAGLQPSCENEASDYGVLSRSSLFSQFSVHRIKFFALASEAGAGPQHDAPESAPESWVQRDIPYSYPHIMNEIQSNSCAVQPKRTFLWTTADTILCKPCFFFALEEDELTQSLETPACGQLGAAGWGGMCAQQGCAPGFSLPWQPREHSIPLSPMAACSRAGGGSSVGLGGLQRFHSSFAEATATHSPLAMAQPQTWALTSTNTSLLIRVWNPLKNPFHTPQLF